MNKIDVEPMYNNIANRIQSLLKINLSKFKMI